MLKEEIFDSKKMFEKDVNKITLRSEDSVFDLLSLHECEIFNAAKLRP